MVGNLDKDPGHDDVYLVPIEGDWYVIYREPTMMIVGNP